METIYWSPKIRQAGTDLLMQDIDQLTTRIDQLLMSAPEEPCVGFFCTNSKRGQK